MTPGSFSRRYARLIQHCTIARASEVLLLQASPLLGMLYGGIVPNWMGLGRMALLLIGSAALTAHVFVFNDWAGQIGDARDPRRAAQFFGGRGISSREVAQLAVALLIVSMLAMALVGIPAVLFGAGVAGLGILYSASGTFGKGTPIVASFLHLIGGAFHFLLGYTVGHTVDLRGVAIALFFGLVFAGGHLNQEVRDYDADRRNRIRTSAVVFGRRRAFVASLAIFSGAYLLLIVLVLGGVLARPLIWGALLWPWHIISAVSALRGEIRFETAIWMQRRYRIGFALLGLAMMLTTSPVADLVRRAHQPRRHDSHQTAAASRVH